MADPNVGSNTLRVPGSESPGPIRISHRVRAHIQAHKEGAVVPLVMPVPVEAPAPPTLADRSYTEYTLVMLLGMGFAFNAGYINGACLNGFAVPNGIRESVTGFTGTYSEAALFSADGDGDNAQIQFSMILSTLGGSAIVGALAPRRRAWKLWPEYCPVLFIGALFLAMSTYFVHREREGSHGVFYWAAAASGLQNALTSVYSGNLIRTTHMTGTTTDMGLCIGQMIRGNNANAWKLRVLVLLTTSFFSGSLVSFWATQSWGQNALIVNCILYVVIGVAYVCYIARKHHLSLWQAATGQWSWGQTADALTAHFGPELEDLFDLIDTDESGGIDPSELLVALVAAGQTPTMATVHELVDDADENKDGQISKAEFVTLMKNHLALSDHADKDIATLSRTASQRRFSHAVIPPVDDEKSGTAPRRVSSFV